MAVSFHKYLNDVSIIDYEPTGSKKIVSGWHTTNSEVQQNVINSLVSPKCSTSCVCNEDFNANILPQCAQGNWHLRGSPSARKLKYNVEIQIIDTRKWFNLCLRRSKGVVNRLIHSSHLNGRLSSAVSERSWFFLNSLRRNIPLCIRWWTFKLEIDDKLFPQTLHWNVSAALLFDTIFDLLCLSYRCITPWSSSSSELLEYSLSDSPDWSISTYNVFFHIPPSD